MSKTTSMVIGASRGIGLSLCRALAARGDRVIATCRTPSRALTALGVEIEAGVDVTDDRAVAALTRRHAADTLIDRLIVSAGVCEPDSLQSFDAAAIRRQLEVNAIGPVRVLSLLAPLLRARAKVVVLSSVMGSMTENDRGSFYGYRMSKAALNMAMVCAARDLAAKRVLVMAVHPGFVRTQMNQMRGEISAAQSAKGILERVDALRPRMTGCFMTFDGQPIAW